MTESDKKLKTCPPEKRVELVEDILRHSMKPLKPSKILERLNNRLDEMGYEPLKEIYMSRIQKESRVINHAGSGSYAYDFPREKKDDKSDNVRKELKTMLDHFTDLTVMDICTPIILNVESGYEKIICNLMYKLFRKKNIYCFEGVGCILMVVKDPSVLESLKELKGVKDVLDYYHEQNQIDS